MSELGNDLPIMRSIICQLVAYNLTDITVKGSWIGPGRLHLIPHVNAPVADLPVRRVLGADHFIADLTLPYGRIAHDYLRREVRSDRQQRHLSFVRHIHAEDCWRNIPDVLFPACGNDRNAADLHGIGAHLKPGAVAGRTERRRERQRLQDIRTSSR